MWPGTSRSMITIVAALMLGLRPRAAAEFSFLLGLVTLTAATGYKTVFGGAQMFEHISVSSFAIGLAASTVSAAIAVRWFVAFLTRHGVAPFGWYRLGIAVLLALMLALGYLSFPIFEEVPPIVAG
jgi:undecaprenyl-diphosphatase